MTPSSASISRTRWPLPSPADRGIAGHFTNAVKTLRHQGRSRAQPRRRQRRLHACMPAAHHHHVEVVFHVKQTLLSDAETLEDLIEDQLDINAPHERIERAHSATETSAAASSICGSVEERMSPARLSNSRARQTASRCRSRFIRPAEATRPRNSSRDRLQTDPRPRCPKRRKSRRPPLPPKVGLVQNNAVTRQHADAQPGHLIQFVDQNNAEVRARLHVAGRARPPALSSGSSLSRSPAVSTIVTGSPARSSRTSITSRVVPATADVRRRLAARQIVQERRFADIRGADQRHLEAFSQSLRCGAAATSAASEAETASSAARTSAHDACRQIVVGEVDRRLDQRERAHQLDPATPPPSRKAHRPSARAPAAPAPRLRRKQIAESLDLRQIELAVQQRPSRELPGLGQRGSREARRAARAIALAQPPARHAH